MATLNGAAFFSREPSPPPPFSNFVPSPVALSDPCRAIFYPSPVALEQGAFHECLHRTGARAYAGPERRAERKRSGVPLPILAVRQTRPEAIFYHATDPGKWERMIWRGGGVSTRRNSITTFGVYYQIMSRALQEHS